MTLPRPLLCGFHSRDPRPAVHSAGINDSNSYSLPLGRMGTREARHGQEGGLRRTDRGTRKRTVVETVGPERDHEESGNIGERTQTVDPCVGRGETDHPHGDTEMGSEREQKSHRPGRREVHDRGTVWAARRVSSWSFLRRVSSRRMFWVHGCKRMACWSDSIRVMVLPPTLRVQMW